MNMLLIGQMAVIVFLVSFGVFKLSQFVYERADWGSRLERVSEIFGRIFALAGFASMVLMGIWAILAFFIQ